jgi:hypothetical protein
MVFIGIYPFWIPPGIYPFWIPPGIYPFWIPAGVYPFWIPAFAGMTGRGRNDRKGQE